ncbi:uncharacterized protein LOC100573813 isoform X2 [Acyrthosiphon pisum]|nr:uncharacterized protein LOC100573813 isoform X2 [Acyrthosiphon pisum]
MHGIKIDMNEYHFESWNDVLTYPSESYHIEYINSDDLYGWRRKRGFFSSLKIPVAMPYTECVDENDEKTVAENTIITSDADVTTTVNSEMTATAANIEAAYKSFTDAKETHIVCIGPDVEKSLVEAGQYLPLVNKLTKYIIPDLSLYDVVMLSLNVASLTTRGAKDYANTEVTEAQTKPDVGATIGQYATGIYDKLKDAFKTHFGHVTNYFSDGEETNSLAETEAETHSILDHVKSKINIFGSFMNSVDSPQTENKENQVETIVTQTYMEDSQPPITSTTVTKTYESGDESIHQATNGESNNAIFNTKLLESGKQKVGKVITEMKNEINSNENSANDSDIEAYDDDNDDETMNDDDDDDGTMDDDDDGTMNDDDGTMNDDEGTMNNGNGNMIDGDKNMNDDDDENNDIQIKEEDFNKVMQESMVLQPDFINTLDGEELLNRIDELQKSLSNLNPNIRKTFKALTEELDIDEHYSDDHVNELIDVLEKTTNYFIIKAIEKNESLTTPPTPPTPSMD